MNNQTKVSGFIELIRYIRAIVIFALVVWGGVIAWHFPWAVDAQVETRRFSAGGSLTEESSYYDNVYSDPRSTAGSSQPADSPYVEFNRVAAHEAGIQPMLSSFVREFGLHNAKVLEVGAGSGTLQDIVDDYTGLDIAGSAARYFHKPFVQGSATELPFDDDSFDVIWTVWTIEHVPNPECAFVEMRRVVRNHGILFLLPAWNVLAWAPGGVDVRPYGDLGWGEKLTKASLSIRKQGLFVMSHRIPIRSLRWFYWRLFGQPTSLRYTRLTANYENYWQADSDAVNSLDSFETLLWFTSRGDECLNCESLTSQINLPHEGPLIIRVDKE